MKAVVAAFNQEKALVGAFSVITNLRMDIFEALVLLCSDFECSAAITCVVRRPAPGCWWGSSASGTGARSLATPGSTPG